MYEYHYRISPFHVTEPPLDPPCEKPKTKTYCNECAEEMDWVNSCFQFYCSQCDEYQEEYKPEDWDEDVEIEYGY